MDANPTSPASGAGSRRRAFTLAAVLLVATAGAGAALRRADAPSRVLPATLPLAFHAASSGPVHFSAHLDRGAILEGSDGELRMEIVLRADRPSGELHERLPSDLVVVLDRSGSMAGEKLDHARAAVAALIERLGERDRFALVTYSDGAELRIPLAPANADAKRAWLEKASWLSAAGGTRLSAGLDLALDAVDSSRSGGRAPRVILISDGLANQGDVSREGLRSRAARASRGEYALSTIGVGADFDEELMASLADAGSGNFHYLQSPESLSEIFTAELDTARETVASGVVVRLTPAPGIVWTDAAGYPISRDAGGSFVVRPGTLFAGQERRFFATLRVPPTGAPIQEIGALQVSYRGVDGPRTLDLEGGPRVARVAREEEFASQLDRTLWTKGVAVEAYNRLRRELSQDVKHGDAEAARERIASYERIVSGMNQLVRSPEVDAQLEDVRLLSSKVEAAAASPAPQRAEEAKRLQADALDAARPGAKKK